MQLPELRIAHEALVQSSVIRNPQHVIKDMYRAFILLYSFSRVRSFYFMCQNVNIFTSIVDIDVKYCT